MPARLTISATDKPRSNALLTFQVRQFKLCPLEQDFSCYSFRYFCPMKQQRAGSHSVHNVQLHLVWSTKYRYQVLTGEVQLRCRELIRQTCNTLDVQILKGVVSKDHIHLHVSYLPWLSVSELVKRLKGRSAKLLLAEYPELKRRYWGGHFWGIGYGAWSRAARTAWARLPMNYYSRTWTIIKSTRMGMRILFWNDETSRVNSSGLRISTYPRTETRSPNWGRKGYPSLAITTLPRLVSPSACFTGIKPMEFLKARPNWMPDRSIIRVPPTGRGWVIFGLKTSAAPMVYPTKSLTPTTGLSLDHLILISITV